VLQETAKVDANQIVAGAGYYAVYHTRQGGQPFAGRTWTAHVSFLANLLSRTIRGDKNLINIKVFQPKWHIFVCGLLRRTREQ
jgi:hypothetical protein